MTVTYCLREKSTGYYGTLTYSSNGDADFCNDTTVELWFDSSDRIWECDTAEQLEVALFAKTPWYISTEKNPVIPNHVLENLDNYEIVKVQKTFEVVGFINTDYITATGEHGFVYNIRQDGQILRILGRPMYSEIDKQEWLDMVNDLVGKTLVFDPTTKYKIVKKVEIDEEHGFLLKKV